jgi:hypothetical protein
MAVGFCFMRLDTAMDCLAQVQRGFGSLSWEFLARLVRQKAMTPKMMVRVSLKSIMILLYFCAPATLTVTGANFL